MWNRAEGHEEPLRIEPEKSGIKHRRFFDNGGVATEG
jgi:hypothetical protein